MDFAADATAWTMVGHVDVINDGRRAPGAAGGPPPPLPTRPQEGRSRGRAVLPTRPQGAAKERHPAATDEGRTTPEKDARAVRHNIN